MLPTQLISPTVAALGASLLFGASIPFAKELVGSISPVLLAGLLYAGSGIGLILTRLIKDRRWLRSGFTPARHGLKPRHRAGPTPGPVCA